MKKNINSLKYCESVPYAASFHDLEVLVSLAWWHRCNSREELFKHETTPAGKMQELYGQQTQYASEL